MAARFKWLGKRLVGLLAMLIAVLVSIALCSIMGIAAIFLSISYKIFY